MHFHETENFEAEKQRVKFSISRWLQKQRVKFSISRWLQKQRVKFSISRWLQKQRVKFSISRWLQKQRVKFSISRWLQKQRVKFSISRCLQRVPSCKTATETTCFLKITIKPSCSPSYILLTGYVAPDIGSVTTST